MNKPEPMSDERIVELRDDNELIYVVFRGDALRLARAIRRRLELRVRPHATTLESKHG